jgi:hypothetical protein
MRSFRRRAIPVGIIAVGVLLTAARTLRQSTQQAGRTDLRNVLNTGYILQDRNADSVVDFLNARIVVPAAATDAEAAAAANLAARLGYETSASNLDLAVLDTVKAAAWDTPVVLIGNANALLARALPDAELRTRLGTLAAGDGAIVWARENATFRRGAVALIGGDATGLAAAADYFASRYPSVWGVRGSSYTDVADRISRFLDQRSLSHDPVVIDHIVISAARRGVARVGVQVIVPDSAVARRVIAALEMPDSTERDSTAAGGGRGVAGGAGRSGRGGNVAGAATDSAGPQPGTSAPSQGRGRVRRADLEFTDLHRIDVAVSGGGARTVVPLLPARPWQTRAAAEWIPRDALDFTLSDLYTISGLFRDTNQDLVPDRMEAHIAINGGGSATRLAALAERIGLETAGIRLPLVGVGGQQDYPHETGFPIVFGVDHYQTTRLIRRGALAGSIDRPGEGFIQFVRGGFSGRNGLVIGAPDKAGLDAVTDYAARRLPYLWDHGKGRPQLADVETEVRRFFQVKDGPGQVALATQKLGVWLDRLKGKQIDSIAVEIAAKQQYAGLDRYVDRSVKERFPSAKTSVATYKTGFGVGKQIFAQDVQIPWEVDAFWKTFRVEALPKLNASSRGRIELRVSESPAVRERIAADIRKELVTKGVPANAFDVQVLSAYKQGYSWLYDEILPKLRGKEVGRVDITYHTLKDSKEVRWQVMESDTRWLQELYPIDATLARELRVPDSVITFTASRDRDPIYRVRALSPTGAEILSASFTPAYVVRPFFDIVPDYEQVRVTTGWLRVESNGQTIVDQRVKTDPETFWDVLQSDTYKRIADYIMDVQEGRPASANAPYFDEFRVELTMSEPDYRLGVDEEVISSLEALHEDIYFETLTLFNLIGGRYGAGAMDYAGRVIPMIKPSVDGKSGRAKITFTGKERAVPQLVLTYRERGKELVRDRYPLSALPTDAPRLRGITVRAGNNGPSQLLFDVASIDSTDRFEQYKVRGTEESIDRTFLPATLLEGMTRSLLDLHRAGVALDALSFDRVGDLLFRIALRDTSAKFSRLVSVPRTSRPTVITNPVVGSPGFKYTGQPIVQWDSPIPPPENDSILARLSTFPGVRVFFAGKSFLGKNVFAADFLPAHESRYISQAKLNALKPTLLLSGRQHANEVSSTSHVLRLGELLVTDSSYARLLKKVNVVLHPITNPDGAQLAYDMQTVTPDFMLHAGYLGALGVDATSGAGNEDAIYPESRVRPMLQEMWLPDIYMNLHGYPSHEWVQYFAGYSGWVRGRTGTQRSWWSPRGWFVPGFNYIDDPRNPEWGRAQFAILDSVAAAITSSPQVNAMNQRLYARYQKYGKQDDETFREYFHKGILVYQSRRGRELAGGGAAGGGRGGGAAAAGADPAGGGGAVGSPRVTYFSVTTEAPDETARGDWLKLVSSAGIAHTSALLRYLATGVNDVRRDVAEFDGVVLRSVARRKPVLPRR